MSVASRTGVRPRRTPGRVPAGARAAALPGFVEPCHPSDREHAPDGPDWIHEIKFDGYRVQVHVDDGKATVYTRNGLDWTDQFTRIERAPEQLGRKSLV